MGRNIKKAAEVVIRGASDNCGKIFLAAAILITAVVLFRACG